MTEQQYCTFWPDTAGCEPAEPVCCEALTAQCLACKARMSVDEYCGMYPRVFGCPARNCCKANTASCLSCNQGMSKEDYCLIYPATFGCDAESRWDRINAWINQFQG